MLKSSEQDSHQNILQQLLTNSLTLSLGTINWQHQAEVSLVPFLYHAGCFWVFVSQLSSHTQHLIDHPNTSVLIHRSEEKAANPFSIQRLSSACRASPELDKREEILDLMTLKLGKTVSLLRQLSDFQLFSLKPIHGRLMTGFGQAFDIDFSTMSLIHISSPKSN